MDASTPYGLDGGLDGGSQLPPNGQDAQTQEPGADTGTSPVQKNASMVSVPPAYTVAEEPYKYTPKANASGEGTVKVNGPAGMDSDGVSVAWEPSKAQSGEHKVTVQTKAADQTVSQEYTVTVAVSEKQAGGTIGAKNGGQITVTAPTSKAQGAGVSIAGGSVVGEKTITIAQVDKSPPAHNTQGTVKAVDFGERGLVFAKPVTLALPLPSDVVLNLHRLGAYVYNPRGSWERVPVLAVDLENKVMLARAQHFSLYAAAQSALDMDGSLARMPGDSACASELVATAVLSSPLREVEASSVNNLSPELRAAVEADALSVDDLLRSPDFRGSLRAVTVFELLDEHGSTVARQARVRTLHVSDAGATVTHSNALGQPITAKAFANVVGSFEEISARLRGAAAVAHLGAPELSRAALAARIHLLYDPEDLSFEAVDLDDLGLSAAELLPGQPVDLTVANGALDADCDGVAPAYDDVDNRLLPGVRIKPEELLSTIVGQPVTLHAELVNAPAQTKLSWEVLDGAPGVLGAGDGGQQRTFTPGAPGRYYVRVFAQVGNQDIESSFTVDALAMGQNLVLPTCAPSPASAAVKIGDQVAIRATLGQSNVPDAALGIEWGLVNPSGDPNALVESVELVPSKFGAVLAPLAKGKYVVGCRAVLADQASPVGVVEVAALAPDANLQPVDLTLSPLAASVQINELLTLTATASDPEAPRGSTLSFDWKASGGSLAGQQGGGNKSSIGFSAATAGVYDLSVTIGDGGSAPQTLSASIVVVDGALGTVDADGDGWPAGAGAVADCNDQDPNVHPTAIDLCGNQLDEDCDGSARQDDCDDDGFGKAEGDCDDADPAIFPGAFELCDGLDNDCDQLSDEDYGVAGQCPLGVGACAVLGSLVCSRDGQHAICEGTPALPQAEICDGLDNDCNELVDDGDVCPVCVPLAGTDSNCDGVDDDCDGTPDDDFVAQATSCGTGACAAVGESTCVQGKPGSTCVAGQGAASDATCNGVDDDCDGLLDEDFVVTSTSCGQGACANTGSLRCVQGHTSDSCQALAATDDDATCDNRDDDCDGSVDEDYVGAATSCGQGECVTAGAFVCVSGQALDNCKALVGAASDDTCDGKDNDCDGATDEEYTATSTQCGKGECASTGQLTCLNGATVDTCSAPAGAADDSSCDGKDNDCNGQVDEDFVAAATSCGTGACQATGALTCSNGQTGDTCKAGTPAADDASCDNVDNDCNGQVDEDFVAAATSCGTGACQATGALTCSNGQSGDSCKAGTPAADDASCDNVDNDCNGQVDEDFVAAATSCGTGACQATGALTCSNGQTGDTCKAGTPAANDASCDNVDNDCNGQVDEDFASSPSVCGVGACQAFGNLTCINGQPGDSCKPGSAANDDSVCNNVDDDCDGQLDEDFVASSTVCGVGVCGNEGTLTCLNGQPHDSCVALQGAPDDASCNGDDDDCDGAVDEDFVPSATTCGVGACQRTGMLTCAADGTSNSCQTGQPAADDSLCNGIDDDCDGEVDEDYQRTFTTCGTGACGNEGSTSCVAGKEVDSCQPLQPSASDDASCDGSDDDCDGAVDEDYVPSPSGCGIGACENTGLFVCNDGELVDTCQPLAGAANDALCDGIDNDCDDLVDEDYQATVNSCGVGECATLGTIECIEGVPTDTCRPNAPLAQVDNTCNLADDDCDGQVDEEYEVTPIQCGAGVCRANGLLECQNGAEVPSCQAGDPLADFDSTCDGVDDDCDELVDEDYAGASTTCGIGACGALGEMTCVDGFEVDSCDPGATNDDFDFTCDNVDDDCDGQVDEEYKATECRADANGQCANGLSLCTQGGQELCQPNSPLPEICNEQDDDCDGDIDEDAVCNCEPAPEVCNGIDDDCNGLIDELPECGCKPEPEVCNGIDDDCNGLIDERGVCTCEATPEVCDGVDNDCNGLIDEIPECGCKPAPEVCNGIDDDCNGLIDDKNVCNCEPTSELCDGLDNDCNGLVDDLPPLGCESSLPGVCAGAGHLGCLNQREQCVPDKGPFPENAGAGLACTNQEDDDCDGLTDGEDPSCSCDPKPEICNGVDDDCNDLIDEGCGGQGLPGETCENAGPLGIGPNEFNLDDYHDDNPSCVGPGFVDRWFIFTVPAGPSQFVSFKPDFGTPPDAISVFAGPCGDLSQRSCGPAGGPDILLAPGSYRVMFDSKPQTGGFGLTVNVNLP